MEETFCNLRTKEVINVLNGKSLGYIIDLVFDVKCAKVLGFIVPNKQGIFSIFSFFFEIFVPYQCVCKFGEDVILVNFDNKVDAHIKIGFN